MNLGTSADSLPSFPAYTTWSSEEEPLSPHRKHYVLCCCVLNLPADTCLLHRCIPVAALLVALLLPLFQLSSIMSRYKVGQAQASWAPSCVYSLALVKNIWAANL
jgi:hypothetical protein